MAIQKILGSILVSISIGVGLTSTAFAQSSPSDYAELSPKTGSILLDSQKFDIALFLPNNTQTPIRSLARLDGIDVSGWFQQCFQPQALVIPSGSTSYLCSNQLGANFGIGPHRLEVDLFFADGVIRHAIADYNIFKTQKSSLLLPYSFTLPSSSPNYPSGVLVSLGDKLKIIASGRIVTWAANPSFPTATPKGSVSCNSAECLIPGAPTGALLVKIGIGGRWIVAADFYNLTADRVGELFFAVNDKNNTDGWADNIGSFDVTISK